MDDIAFTNEPPKRNKPRLTHNAKGQRTVLEVPTRSLRGHCDIKLQLTVRRTKLRKPPRQGEHDGLDASNAGREEMAVDEKLHSPGSRRLWRVVHPYIPLFFNFENHDRFRLPVP
jgi:hypothetical protein